MSAGWRKATFLGIVISPGQNRAHRLQPYQICEICERTCICLGQIHISNRGSGTLSHDLMSVVAVAGSSLTAYGQRQHSVTQPNAGEISHLSKTSHCAKIMVSFSSSCEKTIVPGAVVSCFSMPYRPDGALLERRSCLIPLQLPIQLKL